MRAWEVVCSVQCAVLGGKSGKVPRLKLRLLVQRPQAQAQAQACTLGKVMYSGSGLDDD